MADVKLVKSIYTVGDVTSLGELAAADNAKIPGSLEVTGVITGGGAGVNPALPAFLAYNAGTCADETGDGTVYTVAFGSEVFDQANNFAANVFTAPVTGKYSFSAQVWLRGLLAIHEQIEVRIVTSNRNFILIRDFITPDTNIYGDYSIAIDVPLTDMEAGDTAYVTVTVAGGTKVVDIYGAATTNHYTFFGGHLVC